MVWVNDDLEDTWNVAAETVDGGFNEAVPVTGRNGLDGTLEHKKRDAQVRRRRWWRIFELAPDVDRRPEDEVAGFGTDANIEDAGIAVPEHVDDRIACAPCRERRVEVGADCRSIRPG